MFDSRQYSQQGPAADPAVIAGNKVLSINGNSWKSIIQKETSSSAKANSNEGGFALDFGEQVSAAPLALSSSGRSREPKQSEKQKPKKEKVKKEKKEKKAPKEAETKERVAFEDLPRRVRKQMEKRKLKRTELKTARRLKFSLDEPEEKILSKFKLVYPEQSEEQLIQ